MVARMVTADAMQRQSPLAEYVVDEKHAEYMLTVKDNQRILKRHLTRSRGEGIVQQEIPERMRKKDGNQ